MAKDKTAQKEHGERLQYFINEVLNIKQKDFATQLGILDQDVSKYISGRRLILDLTDKLWNLGCNLNWILTGNGSMFVENEAGITLMKNYHRHHKSTLSSKYDRAIKWIDSNYGGLKPFCGQFRHDYNIWQELLFDGKYNELAWDIDRFMKEAGCNLNWLDTGEGDQYNNEYQGVALKEKLTGVPGKEVVLREDNNNFVKMDELKYIVKEAIAEYEKEKEKIKKKV